jgi:hypothetical protein
MRTRFYLLIAMLFGFSLPSMAVLNTPALVAPVAGATNQAANALLDWGLSTGATFYEVEYGLSPTLSGNIQTAAPTATQFNTTELQWGATYYWRVRAMSANDSSAWSSIISFTVLNNVNPVAPADASVNQTIDVLIDWSAAQGFTQYEYQIDITTAFNTPELRSGLVTTSSATSPTLDFNTLYYWRVRVMHNSDTSAWSNVWSFTTLNSISPVAPANGANNQTPDVLLDWSATTGFTNYQWQADTDPNFGSSNFQTGLATTSSANISNGLYGATYYWRVRILSSTDTSAWSAVWSFNTINILAHTAPANGATDQVCNVILDWVASSGFTNYQWQADTVISFNSTALQSGLTGTSSANISNAYFGKTYYWRVRMMNNADTSLWSLPWSFTTLNQIALVSPANGALDQPVSVVLDWVATTGISNYQFQADTTPSFNSPALRFGLTSVGSSQTTVSNIYFNQTYYWRVRLLNANDTSLWSTVWIFNTLNSVALVSPVNNATNVNVNVTLDWAVVTGASAYHLEYSTEPNFNPSTYQSLGSGSSQFAVSGLPYGSVIYWRVRAAHPLDSTAWSAVWSFTTAYQLTNAPVLVSPADMANNQSISLTLSWNSVPTAVSYQYQIDEQATFSSPQSAITSNLNASISGLNYSTVYWWRVRANNGAGYSPWSTAWYFSTATSPFNNAPLLVSPADGALSVVLAPTLNWDPVNGAVSYEYEYDTDNQFNNPITNTTGVTAAGISGLNYNTTYYWRVRANDGSANSPYSTVWSFTTQQNPLAQAPVLLSPVNNAVNIPTNTTLSWNSVNTATSYEYQIDDDALFGSALSGSVAQTNVNVGPLNNGTVYYWRVRATDGNSFTPYSTVWSFTTVSNPMSAPVTLQSPADASILSGTSTTLQWNAHPVANIYEYEYDTDPAFSSPQGATVNGGTSAFISSLNNGSTYYWRVRGFNGSIYTPWSSVWSFSTPGTLPSTLLASPADGTTGLSLNPTLSWNALNGAVSYEVQWDTDPAFGNPASQTTSNLSVVTSSLNPGQTYYWRVRGNDGQNNGAWSVSWSFTTDIFIGLTEQNEKDAWMVYPNPFSNDLYFTQMIDYIEIYNIQGQVVRIGRMLNHLETATLESGVYVIKARVAEEEKVWKVVK